MGLRQGLVVRRPSVRVLLLKQGNRRDAEALGSHTPDAFLTDASTEFANFLRDNAHIHTYGQRKTKLHTHTRPYVEQNGGVTVHRSYGRRRKHTYRNTTQKQNQKNNQ